MLVKLDLQELKERRTSQKLIFLKLYKVVEGLVPAVEPDDYLNKAQPKRSITAKKFENYQATNIIEKQVKNNKSVLTFQQAKHINSQIHSL
jgi:DNA phosphorothioation-dependent restriction protein DptG